MSDGIDVRCARHVGRVGALAVALGIGMAAANSLGAGVARADDSASSTGVPATAKSSETSSQTGASEATEPPSKATSSPAVREPTVTHRLESAASADPARDASEPASSQGTRPGARRGINWTPADKRSSAAAQAEQSGSNAKPSTPDAPSETQRPTVAYSAAGSTQPQIKRAEVNVVSTLSSAPVAPAATVAPSVAPGPDAPTAPPVGWALLAWARRPVKDDPMSIAVAQAITVSSGGEVAGEDVGAALDQTANSVAPQQVSNRLAVAALAPDTAPAVAAQAAATPVDSTADLQAKFNALRPGDTLVLDPGTFLYSSSLYIRTSSVSVIGNGTTLESTNPADAAIIIQGSHVTLSNVDLTGPVGLDRVDSTYRTRLVFGGDGVHISDVNIIGGTSAGVYVTGGTNFLIERVNVQDTGADGIQITNGSNNGILNDVSTLRTGDDAIAVVSYQVPLYGTVHDITVSNPVVNGSGQRGLVVVGGQRITFNDINVSNTALAAVFVGSQGLYFSRATDDVRVNGGIVTAGGSGGIPGGAVLIWSTNKGQPVTNVTIENLVLVNTPTSAYFNVGIWADVLRGAPVSNVVFRNIAIQQPSDRSPLPFFVVGAADGSYSMTGFTLNGVAVGDPTPPDTPERQFGDAVITISNRLAIVSNRIVDLWKPLEGAINSGVALVSNVLDAFAWVPFVPLINFELNQAWTAIAGVGDAVTGLAHDLINAGDVFVIETFRGGGLITAGIDAINTTLTTLVARGSQVVQVLADWAQAQLDYFSGLLTPETASMANAASLTGRRVDSSPSSCGLDQTVAGSCLDQPLSMAQVAADRFDYRHL